MVAPACSISRPRPQCSTAIRASTCTTPMAKAGSQDPSAIRQPGAPAASARLPSGASSMYATIAPTHRDSGMKYGARPVP